MKKQTKKNRRRGQSSVEYILIIAVVVGAIMAFGSKFKEKITGLTDSMFSGANNNVNSLTSGK